MMPGVLIAASGGLDSTVLAAYAQSQGMYVFGQPFQYGSKHNIHERSAIKALEHQNKCSVFDMIRTTIDLSSVYKSIASPTQKSTLLTDSKKKLPSGHYEEESMKQTVVPGRNLLFIATMAAIAESVGIEQIWIGVHAGDHHIYPDCREEFIMAASATINVQSEGKVRLYAPFQKKTKADIVALGLQLKVPFEWTRTCYSSDDVACGVCGSCMERREAFQLNGIEDPLPYAKKPPIPPKPKHVS